MAHETGAGAVHRPKVVHLTSVHPSEDTRILHLECATLARAGYEVVLIGVHPRAETILGVQLRKMTRSSSRIVRMIGGVWHTYRLAIKEAPAVFHLHDPELLAIAPFLRIRGWPVIYDAHEVLPHQILMKYWIPGWLRPLAALGGRLLERWASWVCSAVVAATPDVARQYSPRRAVLVQNFPDASDFRTAAARPYDSRPVTVAYVGGISEVRGAAEMVQAIECVSPRMGATLALGGEFQPPKLRERLASLPGWERCRPLGRLSRSDVIQLLSEARVGMLVVHPTESYLRIFPVKMFEYMAAGVPIVASDFPLWRELIGSIGCALFVDPMDPGAIAQAIEQLLTDPIKAAAMAARGMAAVARDFTWAVQERRLLGLYAGLQATT